MPQVRIGALCWNQYTDWSSLLEAGVRADRLGYDSLWTWDQCQVWRMNRACPDSVASSVTITAVQGRR